MALACMRSSLIGWQSVLSSQSFSRFDLDSAIGAFGERVKKVAVHRMVIKFQSVRLNRDVGEAMHVLTEGHRALWMFEFSSLGPTSTRKDVRGELALQL